MKAIDAAPLHWIGLAVLAALWVLALALPALEIGGGSPVRGYTVLLRGWRGAEAGVFAWYANPLFIAALAASAFRYQRTAAVVSAASLLLALTSFAAGELARARGLSVPPLSFRAGFYLWLAVPALLCAWAMLAALGRAPDAVRKTGQSRD